MRILNRDSWKRDHIPFFMLSYMRNKIIGVQSLHDQGDCALFLPVKPTAKGVVVPFIKRGAPGAAGSTASTAAR
jgi:hypothetical protein